MLFAWQRRGIALWRKNASEPTAAAPFVVRRRSWLTRLVNDLRNTSLWPRADHSDGALIPTSSGG